MASASAAARRRVNHAWTSEHGRFRHVEWTDGQGRESSPAAPPAVFADMPAYLYEWLSLAGAPGDMKVDGLDLGTVQRAGENWAAWETGIAEGLRVMPPQLRTDWVAFSTFEDIWETILGRCGNVGMSPEVAIGKGLKAA